jgi:hypothetical protein
VVGPVTGATANVDVVGAVGAVVAAVVRTL